MHPNNTLSPHLLGGTVHPINYTTHWITHLKP